MQGTFTFNDGSNYVGEFKDGEIHGQGTFTYLNGDKYVGEFKDGIEHGQGTFTFFDGLYIYVGEYKEGEKHGQGTFTTFGGDKYVGAFKDGNFWNGTTYEIDGNIFGKWVNGKLKVRYPPYSITTTPSSPPSSPH